MMATAMFAHWMLAMVLSAPLAAGQPAPRIAYEDVDGVKGSTDDFPDWVVVYTFADRESSDPLMAWQDRANLAVRQKHAGLRIAHVNFADVSAVPGMFKGVVQPILRGINNRAMGRLKDGYQKAGVKVDASNARFHLIPDWKGAYLKTFGLENAATYHVWIVTGGKVAADFNAGTPDVEQEFVAWFDAYAASATATTAK